MQQDRPYDEFDPVVDPVDEEAQPEKNLAKSALEQAIPQDTRKLRRDLLVWVVLAACLWAEFGLFYAWIDELADRTRWPPEWLDPFRALGRLARSPFGIELLVLALAVPAIQVVRYPRSRYSLCPSLPISALVAAGGVLLAIPGCRQLFVWIATVH